jgi:hypothetical protein
MKKINVDICVCLSSTQIIEVPDDYNSDNLEDYVREQVILPQEILEDNGHCEWYVDEFCVND